MVPFYTDGCSFTIQPEAENLCGWSRFPSKGFDVRADTFVFQKYFETQKEKAHLFSGFMLDVVKSGKEYPAIIYANLGNLFVGEKIRLNLEVTAENLPKLSRKKLNIF